MELFRNKAPDAEVLAALAEYQAAAGEVDVLRRLPLHWAADRGVFG